MDGLPLSQSNLLPPQSGWAPRWFFRVQSQNDPKFSLWGFRRSWSPLVPQSRRCRCDPFVRCFGPLGMWSFLLRFCKIKCWVPTRESGVEYGFLNKEPRRTTWLNWFALQEMAGFPSWSPSRTTTGVVTKFGKPSHSNAALSSTVAACAPVPAQLSARPRDLCYASAFRATGCFCYTMASSHVAGKNGPSLEVGLGLL